ncbi:hypothetical protein [Kordiimonas marina]|uniref:hypothetical protein n=1 Tax=Kordiimonas marina TaxID=2872312 RepID=UPI001FF302A1|nr:hypothetical protein [Kordiimonas marina]MCJ9429321.1 hypothetical protein [Kordiimonas marina]
MTDRALQTLAVAFPSYLPRALTGDLELSLAEIAWTRAPRPARVSHLLNTVFDRISGQPVSLDRVRRLTSSAREWLLQRAALLFWTDKGWFQAQCRVCEQYFDLPLTLAAAPRKPAGETFPLVSVKTSLGLRRFEAPNGGHEEDLAFEQGDLPPERRLLALCGLAESAAADARAFSKADVTRIEAAFEAHCPDVADVVATRCPACQADIEARIDPLQFAFPRSQQLLRDVHMIASAYHWGEADILALPVARRRGYASLIRAEKGRGGGR